MYKFISFEGGDGSGKTTQSKKFYEFLIKSGVEAIWTREIGGTDIAEKIRDVVVLNDILPKTELLMILAARNEHIEKIIKPAMLDNKIVICDRFIDSTAAYQATSEDDITKIFQLTNILFGDFLPDKTLYMKIDPEISLTRTEGRLNNNKYETRSIEFHRNVAKHYDILAAKFPDRITVIDANQHEDVIFKALLSRLGYVS